MTDSGVFWQAASSNIEKARKIKADFCKKISPFPPPKAAFNRIKFGRKIPAKIAFGKS
ncbi:MAG: hypothetical protein ACLR5K_12820 [Acutalibacteraceae bacterium]